MSTTQEYWQSHYHGDGNARRLAWLWLFGSRALFLAGQPD